MRFAFRRRHSNGEASFINLQGIGIGNGLTSPAIQYPFYTPVGGAKIKRWFDSFVKDLINTTEMEGLACLAFLGRSFFCVLCLSMLLLLV